jgi:hypothetical protein
VASAETGGSFRRAAAPSVGTGHQGHLREGPLADLQDVRGGGLQARIARLHALAVDAHRALLDHAVAGRGTRDQLGFLEDQREGRSLGGNCDLDRGELARSCAVAKARDELLARALTRARAMKPVDDFDGELEFHVARIPSRRDGTLELLDLGQRAEGK